LVLLLAVPGTVAPHGRYERQSDEPGTDEPGHGLGDLVADGEQHDGSQGDDRVERAVLEVRVFGKRAAIDQHHRHRSDEHGADPETERDDEQVVGQGERTDHAVERE